jgi:hypothetical protein
MSTMRGLIPSLGAGGSLIAAALCALAVFGGTLAFRGDSRDAAEASSGELTLPAGKVRARTGARAARHAMRAHAIRAVAPRATARPRRTARAVLTTPARRPATTAPTSRPPGTASPPRLADQPAAAPPAPEPPALDPSGVVPPVSVQRTVAEARAVAEPLVADTVYRVTGAVLP